MKKGNKADGQGEVKILDQTMQKALCNEVLSK